VRKLDPTDCEISLQTKHTLNRLQPWPKLPSCTCHDADQVEASASHVAVWGLPHEPLTRQRMKVLPHELLTSHLVQAVPQKPRGWSASTLQARLPISCARLELSRKAASPHGCQSTWLPPDRPAEDGVHLRSHLPGNLRLSECGADVDAPETTSPILRCSAHTLSPLVKTRGASECATSARQVHARIRSSPTPQSPSRGRQGPPQCAARLS